MALKRTRYYYCLSGTNIDDNLFNLLLKASRKPTFRTLFFDDLFAKREKSQCCFSNRKGNKGRRIKKNNPTPDTPPTNAITINEYLKILAKQCSVPNMKISDNRIKHKQTRSEMHLNMCTPFRTKYIINTVLQDPTIVPSECLEILSNPLTQAQLRIYQFHPSVKLESCCSCDSDAVFQVIKSLDKEGSKKSYKLPLSNSKKPLKSKKAKRTAVNKAKYNLITPFAGQTLKKRESIFKCLINPAVAKQERIHTSLNEINKVDECMFFPLEQKSADYKAKLKKCDADDFALTQLADGNISEIITATETVNYHTTLTVDQTAPIKEITEPVREKTVRASEEEDLLSIINVEKNKDEATNIYHTERAQYEMYHNLKPDNLLTSSKANVESVMHNTLLQRNIKFKAKIDFDHPIEKNKAATDQEKYSASKVHLFTKPIEVKIKTSKVRAKAEDTKLEKTLMNKVTQEVQTGLVAETKPGKRNKARGLWTPLEGKKPKQKEKLLRGLVQHGISLPEGTTDSVKNLISKVRKDMGLPPSPKTKTDKEKYANARALGFITPLHGKTVPQKERILRALVKRCIPLPEGRTASEKALIVKIVNEVKITSSSYNFHNKKAAVCPVALLVEKSTKLKEIIHHDNTVERENENTSEMKTAVLSQITGSTFDREKKKYRNSEFTDIVKPLIGDIALHKENKIKRLSKIYTLPEDKTKSEKARIDSVKNEKTSLITSSKLSTETFDIPRNNKVVNHFSVLPEKDQKNSGGLQTETFVLTAQKAMSKVDGPLSLLEGMSTPQKETLLKALAENGVFLPQVKTVLDRNKIGIVSHDQAVTPPNEQKPFDDIKIKVIDENNKSNYDLLTPIINKSRIPEQNTLLEPAKPLRKRTAVKVKKDILKERSRILPPILSEPLPEDKKKPSSKKLKNKASMLIKNLRNVKDRTFGGLKGPCDDTTEKNLNGEKESIPPVHKPIATYKGSLRLEATKLSTSNMSGEYMTTAQKSVFQVLSTYLAHIDVDLLLE